ncbi:SH3 domain-binding glutamic acid-rich protein homolog isoform X2 [Stegodyphus dumicola]|uniref:SH3 domain-binding glutamic acid-rich protein homolog isoform X2 n=1 Tax=Stegodyphus dumicola TaxID=202533 RepID=UPI0015AFCB89|nr:SH3 domain-binding glutamic acid-rich protein homolog isoform X2 [Stegodyphus dumicola]
MPIDLQIIDVTEPGRDEDLAFMQEEAKKHNKKTQLPPQIFNDDVYCGDYADFEVANDDDDIMRFLKLETGPTKSELLNNAAPESDVITQNGISGHENGETKENAEPLGEHESNDTA